MGYIMSFGNDCSLFELWGSVMCGDPSKERVLLKYSGFGAMQFCGMVKEKEGEKVRVVIIDNKLWYEVMIENLKKLRSSF